LAFSLRSRQWLAVVGFLPPIFRELSFAVAVVGVATALPADLNGLGKEATGRLPAQGVAQGRVLQGPDFTMSVSAVAAFDDMGQVWLQKPVGAPVVRCGPAHPGRLFVVSLRLETGNNTVSTTVLRMRQRWFLCQFFGPPPLLVWLAMQALGVSGRG
jgi:hypothetical protein